MKTFPLYLALLALPLLTLAAPPHLPSVHLEVKNIGSSKKTDHEWESGYGSYWRTFTRNLHLVAEVGTLDKDASQIELGYYFFGKRLSDGQRVLVKCGSMTVDLKSKQGNQTIDLQSGDTKARVENYAALNEKYAEGLKFEGWMVRATFGDDNVVLDAKASSPSLLAIARDAKEIERLYTAYSDNQ